MSTGNNLENRTERLFNPSVTDKAQTILMKKRLH